MADENAPVGKLFTHVYLDRSRPVMDSPALRKRIGSFFEKSMDNIEKRKRAVLFFD